MSWTLLVTSHGRWEYFSRTLRSLDAIFGAGFFDRRVLSVDGDAGGAYPVLIGDRPVVMDGNLARVDWAGPPWDILAKNRGGLTSNLAQAWGALGPDEWVFHVEEDFLIHDAPLDEMRATLEANPTVANMVLLRQPWGQHEIAAGSVLAAQPYELLDRGDWLQHQGGFWLNPSVYHSSTVRQLVPGVETSLTKQCLRLGLSFGWWGRPDDPPRVTHIGAEGGMGSPGWLP